MPSWKRFTRSATTRGARGRGRPARRRSCVPRHRRRCRGARRVARCRRRAGHRAAAARLLCPAGAARGEPDAPGARHLDGEHRLHVDFEPAGARPARRGRLDHRPADHPRDPGGDVFRHLGRFPALEHLSQVVFRGFPLSRGRADAAGQEAAPLAGDSRGGRHQRRRRRDRRDLEPGRHRRRFSFGALHGLVQRPGAPRDRHFGGDRPADSAGRECRLCDQRPGRARSAAAHVGVRLAAGACRHRRRERVDRAARRAPGAQPARPEAQTGVRAASAGSWAPDCCTTC